MMITCPACRALHVQGTLFCEQCGTALIGVAPTDDSEPSHAQFAVPAAPEAAHSSTTPHASVMNPPAPQPPAPTAEEGPNTLPLAATQEREIGRQVAGSVPTRVRVLILNTGRLTDWIDEPTIHVGRTDRSANVFPVIDLDADGGHNAGVSRRHVRILRQPDGYYLEDLGSINGTFLNRRRLNPGIPTEIKDGDEVRMGNIVLRIVLGGYQQRR